MNDKINYSNDTIIVVDIIIEKENKVLLYLKKRDNAFELPGGYVLEGMDLYDSVIYHVREQIGLMIEKKDIEIVHIMHYPLGKKLYILLRTEKYRGKLENKIPTEYSDLTWFDFNHLPSKLHKKLFKSFKEIEEGVFYSEYVKK